IRRSKNLLPKTTFSRRLGCLLLLLMVVVAPLAFYLIYNWGGFKTSGSKTATSPSRSRPNLGNGCGVKQNHDGTYTFSWLHIANGTIMDEHNCVVHLLGLNMGGLFLGAAGHATPTVLSWYKQNIPMNVVREAYNAYWWDTDVYVPNEKMHFRQWLETVVQWQEQQGNYVILDNATQ